MTTDNLDQDIDLVACVAEGERLTAVMREHFRAVRDAGQAEAG